MQAGLSEAQLADLQHYATSAQFSTRERLALTYAERITLSDQDVDETLFTQLQDVFPTPAALVELTATIAFENFRSKFNHALRIESNGICHFTPTGNVREGSTMTTGDHVSWRVELVVKPGELENFRALTHEMVEYTRGEPGVLNYERCVSEDGTVVHVYERYADSAAALAHLRTFGQKFGERFLGMVSRTRFTVFGTPNDELRRVLDGFGATYLRPFGGVAPQG